MPNNVLTTDTSFPQFRAGQSNEAKFQMIMDYLAMLREQLQYSMYNLGGDNFNETELQTLGQTILGLVRLEVTNGENSSIVKLTARGTELSSQEIKLSGVVTFADMLGGKTVIDGGRVTGCTITGGTIWSVNAETGAGARIQDGRIRLGWLDGEGNFTESGELATGDTGLGLNTFNGGPLYMGADGEVHLYSQTSDIHIGINKGKIYLNGELYINGQKYSG